MTETDPLLSVEKTLAAEEQKLTDQQVELKRQLASVAANIKRIRLARAALKPKSKAPTSKRPPAPNRKDVQTAVQTALTDHGVLVKEELTKHVADLLSFEGKSKVGLAIRLKEVLADPAIVDTPGGYRLADADTVATSVLQTDKA